jgi:hypothetical protein
MGYSPGCSEPNGSQLERFQCQDALPFLSTMPNSLREYVGHFDSLGLPEIEIENMPPMVLIRR